MIVIRGAVRFKTGAKNLIDVGNVETHEEAREALLSQPGAACALVLVPQAEHVMEPQTA
jgi:hypothetical protein